MGRGNRPRYARPSSCHLLREIPRPLWESFNARREADAKKLGRSLLQDDVLLDLLRQYVQAVTYYGKGHIT